MFTIISDYLEVAMLIYEALQKQGKEVKLIDISRCDIKPCYSCGYCQTKMYRECVHQDDMGDILRQILRSKQVVWVTPLTFGGYSSQTKKVLDRMAIIGDEHYYVKNGEIIKGMKASLKKMIAIGVKTDWDDEEANVFKTLLYENINIMGIEGKAFVVKPKEDMGQIIGEMIGNV